MPCLTARYADGRPKLSTSVKDQDTTSTRVVFDVATTPLPVGEYLVRLDSKSQEDEMAMTYFVVIPPYGAVHQPRSKRTEAPFLHACATSLTGCLASAAFHRSSIL